MFTLTISERFDLIAFDRADSPFKSLLKILAPYDSNILIIIYDYFLVAICNAVMFFSSKSCTYNGFTPSISSTLSVTPFFT